jgi:hypothetical protein
MRRVKRVRLPLAMCRYIWEEYRKKEMFKPYLLSGISDGENLHS